MRRFIKKILLFLALFLVAFLLLKLLTYTLQEKNYHTAFVDKLEKIKSLKNQKKIIILGGSGAGWGLSAEMVQQSTGITTINLGHHAGYGFVDYEEFLLQNLTEEDIIIFSPEWRYFANPAGTDTAILDDLIYTNIKYGFLLHKPWYVLKTIFCENKIRKRKSNPLKRYKDKIYVYDCTNKNGDVISHCALRSIGPDFYSIDPKPFSISKFYEAFPFLNTHKTFILFPPTQSKVFEKSKGYLKGIETELRMKKLNVIDDVESNVYEDSAFFDERYHLTCATRITRTKKLVVFLQKEGLSAKNGIQ